MTTRAKSNQFNLRIILLTVLAALVTAVPAMPQSSGNAVKESEGPYSLVDVTAFFGTQWYQIYQGSTGGGNHFFEARPVVGERVTENFSKYVGLEEAFTLGFNRFAFLPAGSAEYATIGSRNTTYSLTGVFSMRPRDSRLRPYAILGPGAVVYHATGAVQYAGPPALLPANFKTQTYAALIYGVGAIYNVNRHIAFQYDLRGAWTPKTSDFALPSTPGGAGSIFITHPHGESSMMFTSGIVFRFGYHEPPAPYVPPPCLSPNVVRADGSCGPPPVVVEATRMTVSRIAAPAAVCPGENARLTVTASVTPNAPLSYQWMVGGTAAPGGTGAAFNLPTTTSGNKAVSVTVSGGGTSSSSGPINVLVRTPAPPTIQFSVSPTTIAYGDRLPLNAQAAVGDCATPTPVRYAASAGTIAGTNFDSSSMTFDPNGAGQQQQVVRLTATETDSRSQTVSANANVTVTYKRAASRTDIVFPNRSSRVNNAAKRYLIEVLTPKLKADPNAKVILIGHRDASETGKVYAKLDMQRIVNAAAVLSAGKGICPSLDLSRVQVMADGTDQADAPMPFADSSVKERTGQTATDDKAQFRRVEVWFIPGGSDAPAVSGLGAAPEKEIKLKGCPK